MEASAVLVVRWAARWAVAVVAWKMKELWAVAVAVASLGGGTATSSDAVGSSDQRRREESQSKCARQCSVAMGCLWAHSKSVALAGEHLAGGTSLCCAAARAVRVGKDPKYRGENWALNWGR